MDTTTSASRMGPSPDDIHNTVEKVGKPFPLSSLTAAALLRTRKVVKPWAQANPKASDWQEEAWQMYDEVGEQRFLSNTIAGRLGQARFYVGRMPDISTEAVEAVVSTDADKQQLTPVEVRARELLAGLGNPAQLSQLVMRYGVNMVVSGECWLVGLPPVDEGSGGYQPTALETAPEDRTWNVFSTSEVKLNGDKVTIDGYGGELSADDVEMVQVWRPHPRKWIEPDSPTRSSLPILRELVGLTMHISAQIDSRLAGAGVLLVPLEAAQALNAGREVDGDEEGGADPFMRDLMEAMVTPIEARDSAAAVVPLTLKVPGDTTAQFKYLSFSTPLDAEARSLREEAIRRLALGQDCPPELLLGTAGMNHWGGWLVREDVVTTHLEPTLAMLCDALTTQYLWAHLLDEGHAEAEVRQLVIWYSVDHLIVRPTRMQDARELYTAGVISDAALRNAGGFDDDSAPEVTAAEDPAVTLAFDMVRAAPSLAQSPGLVELVRQIREVQTGQAQPDAEPPALVAPPASTDTPSDDAPGATEGGPPDIDQTMGPEVIEQGAPA